MTKFITASFLFSVLTIPMIFLVVWAFKEAFDNPTDLQYIFLYITTGATSSIIGVGVAKRVLKW